MSMAMLRCGALATALLLAIGASGAQEEAPIDQGKLYVSDPAACSVLEEKGVDAWTELDFRTLEWADGIHSMEYHCNFVDVKSLRDENKNFFIEAFCEIPGHFYPDSFAVAPFSATQIKVVSSYDALMDPDGAFQEPDAPQPPGVTIFHRCDNLSEIPVD